jgi:hypothetical protein
VPVILSVLFVLLASALAHGDPGWLDLPENEARAWIIEHARHQAEQFCEEYPANAYCHRAGREASRRSQPPDFCARYHLRREDYARDGWRYWRCVK